MKQRHVDKRSNSSHIPTIVFLLYMLLFMITPYNRGLFFHTDYFGVGMFIILIFWITVATFFRKFQEIMENNGIVYILLGIPFMYFLSFWFSYLPSFAAYETLKWFTYTLVFLILIILLQVQASLRETLFLLCWGTTIWIVGLVFLVNVGVLEFHDAVLSGRFSSVFQYPNTLASILSGFIIAGLFMLTKRVPTLYSLLVSISLFPFTLAFLLTDSRGGFLVFAFCWLVSLFFLAWKEQVAYIKYSLVLFAISLWGYSKHSEYMTQEQFSLTIAILILGAGFFGIYHYVMNKYIINKYEMSKRSKFEVIIPSLGILVGLLGFYTLVSEWKDKLLFIFPEGLQNRLATISFNEHSVVERLLFFRDSFAIWTDHLLIGTGGGGWRGLFEVYKSLPYYSTQAHSFYMQTLVEVGLLGSLFVFGFIFYILIKGIWVYFKENVHKTTEAKDDRVDSPLFLLPASILIIINLLLHASIDFNMSFGTYNLYLFSLLALIWSYTNSYPLSAKVISPLAKRMIEKINIKQKQVISRLSIIVLLLSSVYAMYVLYSYNQAENVYAAVQGKPMEEVLAQVDRAISQNSLDVRFRQLKLNVLSQAYQQTGEQAWLERMKKEQQVIVSKEPTMFNHYLGYSNFLWDVGEREEAIELMLETLEMAPWQQQVYDVLFSNGVKYLRKLEGQDIDLSKIKLTNSLEQVAYQYESKIKEQVDNSPEGYTPRAPLRRNYDTQLNIAYIHLFNKNYADAFTALDQFIWDGWKETNWYLRLFESEEKGSIRPFTIHSLKDDIEQYMNDHIIVMVGRDKTAGRLSIPVKELLSSIGSNINALQDHDSYVGVIAQGQMVVEKIDGNSEIILNETNSPELVKLFGNQTFTISSAGRELGDRSSIMLNGVEHSPNGHGINLVIFDKNLNVIDSIHYNTNGMDYKFVLLEGQ